MWSTLFMTDIATRIISSCNSVGVVEFAVYQTDIFISFGIMKNGQIKKFECIFPWDNGYDWGYAFCM